MDIELAIKTALEYEQNVVDVYGENAEKFESPVAAKIFSVLGKEEQGHVDYLEAKLEQWKKTGKVSVGTVETIIPDKKTLEINLKNLQKTSEKADLNDEIRIFQKALELETKASNFYKDLVGKLGDEDRKLFQRFVEIEEGHEAIIQSEIDVAQGLGFWFDFTEFDLEAS